jgi:hypothetical protein
MASNGCFNRPSPSNHLFSESLVNPAFVFQPAIFMPTLRVVMCPVQNTALAVPFILTIKLDSITSLQV